jgi:uncharacterized Zn finger protein
MLVDATCRHCLPPVDVIHKVIHSLGVVVRCRGPSRLPEQIAGGLIAVDAG